MIARDLIGTIPPLKTTDSVQMVFDRMDEFRVNHLPLVDENLYLGIVSYDDIIETIDLNSPIGDIHLSIANGSISPGQHIYNVIRHFYESHLTLVPVTDEEKNYLGSISINSIVEYIATLTSAKEPGGVIVLEISNRENSLAHMAQIVESNNAQILSSYVQSFPNSTRLEVTLKLNHLDISGIVASFQRYNYHVKETFNDVKADDNAGDRYDQLMNYLNL